jgi:DNA-binding beta-propeller fold protein YncE
MKVLLIGAALVATWVMPAVAQVPKPPVYKVDPSFPKDLPDNLILGQVSGVSAAPDGTIWIIHRPRSLMDDEKGAQKTPPETRCCIAAPPVLQFSRDGTLLKKWGGPGAGYTWPANEHGIHVDREGNVWLGGNEKDDQVLKFTSDGKFIMQIGKVETPPSSMNITRLNRPAHMMTDDAASEIYIADGYGNRRIIVFDSKTGAYKRHWGAYGTKTPHDEKLPPYKPTTLADMAKSFSNPVHCVRISDDGHVYVCDRANDRIQVFKKDGTFVKEFQVEPQTLQNGSVWDLVLSTDKNQRYIHVADGANMQIVTLDRQTGTKLSSFGRPGRNAGNFKWVHNMAIDSRSSIYTAEVGDGRRVQKFDRVR